MGKKRIVQIIAVVSVVAIALFGVHQYRSRVIHDPDYAQGQSSGEVIVEISQGESGSEIARNLFKSEVVKSSAAFFRLAVTDNRSTKIAPGPHRLSRHIPAAQALEQLLDPSRITSLIKIKEGAWVSEIVDQLVAAGFKRAAVLDALNKLTPPAGFHGAEGILFPAQYSFAKGTSADSALKSMVAAFSGAAKLSAIDSTANDFMPMEMLTIASLIQAEGDTKDFAKISRVVRNRLKIGMPLQFDSTVHFITHTRGKMFLSTNATKTISLYNTYLHYGLPPGPIGSPGLDAMKAAVSPVEGNWTYFITVKPGDTRFTSSFQEFTNWKFEYEKNLKAGAFA
ncbi:MAG: endolytic transglycosylase MltG [Actinobacteria bacterium]|nr:endolytic transglycosylase MltG [Actinomycetota bacterium]